MKSKLLISFILISVIFIAGCISTENTTNLECATKTELLWSGQLFDLPLPDELYQLQQKYGGPGIRGESWVQHLDIDNKKSVLVFGSIKEKSNKPIDFFILDQKNFFAYDKSDNYNVEYRIDNVATNNFRFVPDHSDIYYFVFENKETVNKTLELQVFWSYSLC
ncbi:MAG: hypothetical protein WC613_05230 [Candidatus Aenigmatarchaeota archaeon]